MTVLITLLRVTNVSQLWIIDYGKINDFRSDTRIKYIIENEQKHQKENKTKILIFLEVYHLNSLIYNRGDNVISKLWLK